MLYDWHRENGARMIEFAGWDMPIQYSSIREEHNNVRANAGLFDLGHMGRIRINGRDRLKFTQYVFTNDMNELPEGAIHYGFLCNPQGGVIDDITAYRAPEYILLVVNACNTEKALNWLKLNESNYQIEIEDVTVSLGMIAIQGPRSLEIINRVGIDNFDGLKPYHFVTRQLSRAKALVSRTGYTGEDGFEIYCGAVYFKSLWERFLDEGFSLGLKPAGLGARDTLRTEACLPLYGNELNEDITPIEARLTKFVKFTKNDFIGKDALEKSLDAEFTRRLVAFEMMDKSIPRKDHTVFFKEMKIGRVTSGTYSPTMKKGIGMAYVDKIISSPDTEINIVINNKPHPATIRKRPLYKRRKS
mgnify:CR=1 FL=1